MGSAPEPQKPPRDERLAQRGIGRYMWILFWIAVVIFGTYAFSNLLENERNPNQSVDTLNSDGVREVVLQRNRYGHYNVTGAINGQPVEFFLDTGATDISVPEHIARKLGLKKQQEIQFYTANGIARGWATRLRSVSIGNITLHDLAASINPNVDDAVILLGMSFLKHIEFTQKGDQLILRQPAY